MITLNQRRFKVGICSCPFSHNKNSPVYPMQKDPQSCILSNQKLKPTDEKPTTNDLKMITLPSILSIQSFSLQIATGF
jgi:hypothetical protein